MPFAALALLLLLASVLVAPLWLRAPAEAAPPATVVAMVEPVAEEPAVPSLSAPLEVTAAEPELLMDIPPDVAAAAAEASAICAPAVPEQFVSLMGKLATPAKPSATGLPPNPLKPAALPQSRPKVVNGVRVIYGNSPPPAGPANQHGVKVIRGKE